MAEFQDVIERMIQQSPWLTEAQAKARVGEKAYNSGAGRLGRFAAALRLLPSQDRRMLIDALAEMWRPMSDRELEKALMLTDLSMSDRKRIVASLKGFSIMVVMPK